MPLLDVRPQPINLLYRSGTAFKLTLTWPTGSLAGRTFVSTLGADTLALSIAGDIMTITVTDPQTVAAQTEVTWLLTETTSGKSDDLLVGTWTKSALPGASTSASYTVVIGGATVTVSVSGQAELDAHKVDLDAHGDPYITRPRGWGTRWFAALDEADTRLVRVGVLGDSVSCGLFPDDHDLGWVGLLRTALQARYGDGGSGWLDWFNSAVGGFGGPGGPNGGDTTATGAWTDVPGGVNGNARRPTVSGNGATLTFRPRGTTLEIVSRTDPAFGRYDYQIDGGSVVQVAQNVTAAVSTVTISGLSPGAHTVVITAAAGQCRIHGVRGRNATGILVDNLSIGGRSIVSQGLGLDVAAEGLAGQTTLSTTFSIADPLDQLIVPLGVNDAVQAASPNYDTMWSVLNNVQRETRASGINSTTPPEVVQLVEHISGFADTSVPYKYPRIAGIQREWAASIGAAVVDTWALGRYSGEYAVGLNWFGFGLADVHLATAGSIAYRDLVLSLIDPEGLS